MSAIVDFTGKYVHEGVKATDKQRQASLPRHYAKGAKIQKNANFSSGQVDTGHKNP